MEPVRTCVGCRQRASRRELIRVVANQQLLIADLKKSLSGRGAWLHPDANCLEMARNRNSFARALKISRQLDDSALTQTIEQAEEMTSK